MVYDMRHHKFSGAWSLLLRQHLERLRKSGKLTRMQFVHQLGMTEQMVTAYMAGRNKPPLEKVEKMADILGLDGDDRDTFIFQAHEHYCPEAVWLKVNTLAGSLDLALKESAQRSAEVSNLRKGNADLSAEIAHLQGELAMIQPELVKLRALAVEMAHKFAGLKT